MIKQLVLGLGLCAMSGVLLAAPKPCAELQAEIDAKLKAKGVAAYSLEVVDKGTAGDKPVVGSCDAGSKEITYIRGRAVALDKPGHARFFYAAKT